MLIPQKNFSDAFIPQDVSLPSIAPGRPARHIVRSAGLEISYLIWGETLKPALIMVHGGRDHGRNWDWMIAQLIDRYCIIVPDLRGHGDSGWSSGGEYSSTDNILDLAAVTEDLTMRGIKGPFALIGHSLGGQAVLGYAGLYPDDCACVVAMEGFGFSPSFYKKIIAKPYIDRLSAWAMQKKKLRARGRRYYRTIDEMVNRMASVHKNLSAAQAAYLATYGARQYEQGWAWKYDPQLIFNALHPTSPEDYLSVYSQYKGPSLLLYGEKSFADNPQLDGRVARLQNAKFISYPAAGHWMHHDDVDLVTKDITAFLEKEYLPLF